MVSSKSYEQLTDLEKVQKQWHKLSGLHTREEWSAAIVRAATAAELAATFAVRREFEVNSEFDPKFVDSLLRWANGLSGKLDRLLLPMSVGNKTKNKKLKTLKLIAETVNAKRNAIAHQGEFCGEDEAREVIAQTKDFITVLVQIYEPQFVLKTRNR